VRELGGTAHVVLEGADPRGTIYALYSFADEFLGVPPLWFWSGWNPARRESIEVPSDTERIFPPAYVRWRAWFNNDTDFLTPWRERSPAHDHAVYETVLRLKYNTYEIGSVADLRPDAPRLRREPRCRGRARPRSRHHAPSHLAAGIEPPQLGMRIGAREGREPPPLSVREPAKLAAFWRYHAETAQRAGFEQVWTIVFRGAGDIPFWQTFKDAPADTAARAQIISDMLRTQVAIVKEITGNPAPDMRTTLYNEGSTMFAAGLLRPPAEPTLIWNFVAARRDHFPAEDVRNFKAPPDRLIGYYLNFQFTSSGSHLAAAEGPWKMAANYRIVDGTGAPAARVHRRECRQHPRAPRRARGQRRHDVAVQGVLRRRVSPAVLRPLFRDRSGGRGGGALSRLLSGLLDAEAVRHPRFRPAVSFPRHALRARGRDAAQGHGGRCATAQSARRSSPRPA
jgi:hypothetical protein